MLYPKSIHPIVIYNVYVCTYIHTYIVHILYVPCLFAHFFSVLLKVHTKYVYTNSLKLLRLHTSIG